MILKTTTNEFCFINVSFYETVADPRHFFSQEYDEMPEYEEESDFDFDSYYNKFIPFVQEWANKVGERLYEYGVNNISEHLFKDIYTAKADELYHHVLDKFGWAWRDPKYKSETELCAMLKWAKEKGLTIEELSI